jgi:hypothetical protein
MEWGKIAKKTMKVQKKLVKTLPVETIHDLWEGKDGCIAIQDGAMNLPHLELSYCFETDVRCCKYYISRPSNL